MVGFMLRITDFNFACFGRNIFCELLTHCALTKISIFECMYTVHMNICCKDFAYVCLLVRLFVTCRTKLQTIC